MSRQMLVEFGERLIAGLQKKAIVTPSRWVQEHVKNFDGTPMSFRRFPWQPFMLDSVSPHNIAAKGAQLGISRVVLCRGMCANDMEKRDCLYILPSMNPTGSDFSSAVFDAIVNASPRLFDIYDKSNVGHKRTSTNNFYIRGGQSRAGGKSVAAGMLVQDEIDEISKEFQVLVRERMSGQDVKQEWDISTPTRPDYGIDRLWQESTQEYFYFPCPSCSKWIHLFYPECLNIVGDDPDSLSVLKDSYLQCPECKNKLPHEEKVNFLSKARFIPTVVGKEKRGFHVNQLYSTTTTPGEVAASAIRAQFSEIEAQEFWNSKMGRPHRDAGSQVAEAAIEACRMNYTNGAPRTQDIVTMGVDVGSVNHVEVCEWRLGESMGSDVNSMALPRVLWCGQVRDFEQLDTLMVQYGVNMCVIDAMPETRKAFEFSQRFWGWVRMCYYAQGVTGKLLVERPWDNGEPVIHVNRTAWMDQALFRYKDKKILLPMNVPFEYIEHVKTPSRSWRRDKNGNPVASWLTPDGRADHHAHARTYAEIALQLAVGSGANYDTESPLDG